MVKDRISLFFHPWLSSTLQIRTIDKNYPTTDYFETVLDKRYPPMDKKYPKSTEFVQ
jgi:hypothetical protein